MPPVRSWTNIYKLYVRKCIHFVVVDLLHTFKMCLSYMYVHITWYGIYEFFWIFCNGGLKKLYPPPLIGDMAPNNLLFDALPCKWKQRPWNIFTNGYGSKKLYYNIISLIWIKSWKLEINISVKYWRDHGIYFGASFLPVTL